MSTHAAVIPRAIALAFFLSGASALVYELLWFRLLAHVFGSTATATATLLAAYLFGLGLGAWIFGRISDRVRRLPETYVAVELGIAAFGIASRVLLERGSALYALGHDWAAGDPARLLLARFVVSFGLVAIPTTLMGGTFPLMVQMLRQRHVGVGRAAGRAYAINTAGAAIGTLALPFVLLPRLGIALSLATAAVANVLAALLVWLHARRAAAPEREATGLERDEPPGATDAVVPAVPLLGGFFLSSFASLALETVWTRHLSLFFGPQVHTFAFVLFAYLVGLFVGGAAFARLASRGVPAIRALRAGLLVAGGSAAATIPFLDSLIVPQIAAMSAVGVSHASFLWTGGLATLVLVLPSAVGFGLVFPAVVALLSGADRPAGASVALAYAVSTAGTTLGAIAAGFFLVPRIGSQRTLELSALFVAAAYLLVPAGAQRRPRIARRVAVAALLALPLLAPRWDWRLAHATYSKDPRAFAQKWATGELWESLRGDEVAFLEEGAEATVAVVHRAGSNTLLISGKPDASDVAADMVTQQLLGLYPGLFHPDPRRAFVLGLGSGTTAAALLRFPLESVEVAEISPEVVQAARLHFGSINDRCLDDPRLALRLDDGRNYLRFQPPGTYDLIVSQPSNPWMAGVSGLFTAEFFGEVRSRLRTGGVFCQWLQYYHLSYDHIRLVLRTFAREFPESAMFVVIGPQVSGDLLLIGSNGPLRLARLPDDPELPERAREALAALRIAGAQQFLFGLVAASGDLGVLGGAGPFNSDDLPTLELEAPRDRFLDTSKDNLAHLLGARPDLRLATGPLGDRGFSTSAVPTGTESFRGACVLTRDSQGGRGITRWSLLGREYRDGDETTGIYRLLGPPRSEGEVGDVARALAGAGSEATETERGAVLVNGHAATWVSRSAGGEQTVAVGWICPARGQALFVTRRSRAASPPPGAVVAQGLGARFACSD